MNSASITAIRQLEKEKAGSLKAVSKLFDSAQVFPNADDCYVDSYLHKTYDSVLSRLDFIHAHRLRTLVLDLFAIDKTSVNHGLRVTDVTSLDSDFHYGHRVQKLVTDTGLEFVFKHGSGVEYQIYNTWLGGIIGKRIDCIHIENEDGGKFYLRRFFPADSYVKDSKQAANFFGQLLGFCYVFNATDMHCENVVISDNIPLPIDLECLIYPFENLTSSFDIEFSGIIVRDGGESKERKLSALLGGGNLEEYVDPWLDDASGKVEYRKPKRITNNMILSKSGAKIPLPYLKNSFLSGLEDYLQYAKNNRNNIIEFLDSVKSHYSRKIYAPTLLYRIALSESICLSKNQSKELFRKRLRDIRKDKVNELVINHEIESLLKGDVPYFSLDIKSGKFQQIKLHNNCHMSPYEMAQQKIQFLSDRAISKLIRKVDGLFSPI